LDDLLQGNPHSDARGNPHVWSFYDSAASHRKNRLPAVDHALANWDVTTTDVAAGKRDGGAIAEAAQRFQDFIEHSDTGRALVEELRSRGSPFWEEGSETESRLSADAQAALASRRTEIDSLKATVTSLPCAHGVQEGGLRFSLFPGIQDVPVHIRGSYEQFGESVSRRFPKVLMPDDSPITLTGSGRLELARWIGSTDNPLAARVMVNRMWQHHFGDGIVRTPSNFGQLGEPPTHPELLDWLALQFVASSWSVKDITRLIVTSATYQQSSQPSPDQLGADPHNLFFGRMNRRRLDAEQVRDSLASVGNRLDFRAGGPPDDSDSRRRMLYLKSSRSDKSGFGALFDAPDPSIHVEKRTASTVAPQALDLMNGSLALDAAIELAHDARFVSQPPELRMQAMYGFVLGRDASQEELDIASEFFESFRTQSASEASITSTLDAWEAFAQVLLLSNEFMYVD
jgi:hypothetical protein